MMRGYTYNFALMGSCIEILLCSVRVWQKIGAFLSTYAYTDSFVQYVMNCNSFVRWQGSSFCCSKPALHSYIGLQNVNHDAMTELHGNKTFTSSLMNW